MTKEQLRPVLVKMAQFAYSGHFIDWHACDRGILGDLQGKGSSSNRSRARTGDLVTIKMFVSCASSHTLLKEGIVNSRLPCLVWKWRKK